MQIEARDVLIDALEGPSAGYLSPLLRKTGSRRRAAPHRSAEIELRMLMWLHWQRGRGRKAFEAEEELANRANLSVKTIRKWSLALTKVYGRDRVDRALELARAVGETEREWFEAERPSPEDFRPLEFERGHQLWITSWTLERRVCVLVEQRKAAIAKRR